jgi:ABC-2 type transport system permease protein
MIAASAYALRRPGGLVPTVRKYAAIFTTTLRDQLAYLGEMLLRTVFLVMILYIFLQLWRAAYAAQGTATIAGFTVAQMIWYLALTESIVLSRPSVSRAIDEEVRSGAIAYTLGRPYGYATYRLTTYLAERLLRFATTLAVAGTLALLYAGPIAVSPVSLAAALVATAGAIAIDFVAVFGIGLLAFWVEDTSSIELIYSRAVMLLGGMLLPLDVFPEWLQRIAFALPFSAMLHGPARLALAESPADFWPLIARQLVYLALASSAVTLLYRAALRRLNVHGG